MLLKNLIWPNKEKALRSRLLCHFGKVCDGPYSFHTRGLFQCSKSRTGYLKLLCIIMANVISREGRLEPLGKCFPFFCGFSCIVPRNFCRFLEDVCVCVCVCVQLIQKFTGTWNISGNISSSHTSREISGKYMELQGWPCTIVLAWYSQSPPCCFLLSPS